MPVIECPICRKSIAYADPSEVAYRPFCSRRCKLVDLGRWLNEEYRISEEVSEPGSESDPMLEGEPDAARQRLDH